MPQSQRIAKVAAAIPYVDLAAQHAPIRQEILAAVGEVLDSGHFILGEQVAEFEERFAVMCGARHAIGVNSGTDALVLALKALGIGPGDEVITVANSFIASAGCVVLAGAKPVLVDCGEDYNIDPAKLAAAVTDRTQAILPVHLTGRPCDMDAIMEIAKARKLHVVEDAAQSVLAEYRGKKVGTFGAIGCFSLHPLKTLNACGDGGVLTTDDDALATRLRIARNLGLKTRDECVAWAPNSRLDTMQAAVLLVKLKHVEAWTARRRENAARYRQGLEGIRGIRAPLPEGEHEKAVYHTFVVQAENRDGLRAHLSERGIGSSVHYPIPIHLTDAGRGLGYGPGSFPVAERQAGKILSLPVYPELTPEKIDRVCSEIRAFYKD